MFAFFGSNHRHGKPHHENITLFQAEAYGRIDLYEKPTGMSGWFLGLVALRELLVELELVETSCRETVRQTLKKNALQPGLKEPWVIPPEANAEFVCAREDLLAIYQRPYDAQRPHIGVDEGTKPWVQDVRPPLPAVPGRWQRLDDEYERHGTGHLFRMCEPLAGQREVLVTERRPAVDDAAALQHLMAVRSPRAATRVLVQDHLHTYTLAALDEAFPPEEARRLIEKREVHDTPKPGSWLNLAAIELGVWRQQCLDRRIPDFATVTDEVAAWQSARNAAQVQVNGPFTTADARVKLQRLYPILEPVKSK